MASIYTNILQAISNGEKLLAVLIDPDKTFPVSIPAFMAKLHTSIATHIFVGGSEVEEQLTDTLVAEIKKHTHLPVVLFPGDVSQITDKADVILFLSLISGRNADYLIGKHVASIPKLRETNLEIIPTGYLLIAPDSYQDGKQTAVQRVTETKPMHQEHIQNIVDTAKAGEILGMKLIYLEAGSGTMHPVSSKIISNVKKDLQIPLIVGGGIRSKKQLETAYQAGADLVVIGTAFEKDDTFFDELKNV